MKYCLGYITAPTKAEAKKIARELLQRKLVACANILSAAASLYEWKGAIHEKNEFVILIKTMACHESKIINTVKKVHSYECPCVVFWPLTGGNKEFLRWIRENC